MKPMEAALAGALISGVGMYAIGTHAQDRLVTEPAAVPGYSVAAPQSAAVPAASNFVTPQPVATPAVTRTVAAPQRTVYRNVTSTAPVSPRAETRHRSVAKTALIIGGSTAGAAGLGGLLGGKKGALVGAALGGGAASIYEATRR